MDNVAMMKAQSTATMGRKEMRFESHYCLAAATLKRSCSEDKYFEFPTGITLNLLMFRGITSRS